MDLMGKFCSLHQFFWTHFACEDKSVFPKGFFLNFTSNGDKVVCSNSLRCSTKYGQLNYFIKVSLTLLSTFLLAFKIM